MHVGHLPHDRSCMMYKGFACFGKANTAPSRSRSKNLPYCFHVAQAFTCCWKRQANFSRTVSDAARIGYREEQAKVGKIKTHK